MKIFQICFLYYLLESGIDFHVWCEAGIKLPSFSPPVVIQLAQHHLWQRSFMPPPQQCVVKHMPIYAGLFLGSLFFIVLFVYPSIQSFFKLSW